MSVALGLRAAALLLLLALTAQAATLTGRGSCYNQCVNSCEDGSNCEGCECLMEGSDDQTNGICDANKQCLDKALVDCKQSYDPDLSSRPKGVECSTNRVCLSVGIDGKALFSGTRRCVTSAYVPCEGKSFGDFCWETSDPENSRGSKQCGYPDGDSGQVLQCLDGIVEGCLGKADGTACSREADPLNIRGNYKNSKSYSSVCAAGVCVGAWQGACVGKDEGESCGYTDFEVRSEMDRKEKKKYPYKLVRTTSTGGRCEGVKPEDRQCNNGKRTTKVIEKTSCTDDSHKQNGKTLCERWSGVAQQRPSLLVGLLAVLLIFGAL